MTIIEYACTRVVEDNQMFLSLSHTISETLTEEHLEKAKKLLCNKFLIGLLEYNEERWWQIISYFGIDLNRETDTTKWEYVHSFKKHKSKQK